MSERTEPMSFSRNFQLSILHYMLKDLHFVSKCSEFLKKSDFANELSWFFGVFADHYRNFGAPATRNHIESEIKKHEEAKVQSEYYQTLDDIYRVEYDPKAIRESMTAFIQASVYVGSIHKINNAYNTKKYKKAWEDLTETVKQITNIDFNRDDLDHFGNSDEYMALAAEQLKNAIPIGIKIIDDAMFGGMMMGTWTTFLGASGAGKSMLMPNLAFHAAVRGKKTFVTIHEDDLIPTKMRYLSRFSGIPYKKLMEGAHNLTPEENAARKKADDNLNQHVCIRTMFTDNSYVESVIDQVKRLKEKWDFDLFLCDYPQCLGSRAFKDQSAVRLINEHVILQLKQMCLDLRLVGAGGAQVNRSGNEKNQESSELLRTTDVAEAFGIIKKSDNVITINRSDMNKQKNEVVFLLAKSRNGDENVAVKCNSDYTRCATHLSEQYLVDCRTGGAITAEVAEKNTNKKVGLV